MGVRFLGKIKDFTWSKLINSFENVHWRFFTSSVHTVGIYMNAVHFPKNVFF